MTLSRPKLGVCTWTFGNLPLKDAARRMAALHFDGIELHGDLTQHSAEEVKMILQDNNLELFAMSPINVDLAHPDTAVRQSALDYYSKLLDFAAECQAPLVLCRGYLGRVRPVTSFATERELFETAVSTLTHHAAQRNIRLAVEPLNRYETHLIHTCHQAVKLINEVGVDNLGIALNAFHMNIEEQDAGAAIRTAGDHLWMYHMSDSNRQGIGRGHLKLGLHLWGLEDIGYEGPILFDCMAPGFDPFSPIKDGASRSLLETYLQESRSWF